MINGKGAAHDADVLDIPAILTPHSGHIDPPWFLLSGNGNL
ncbi:MAG: hypothetical protein WEA36_02925 [Balneolaceae bacterium]